jgi:plastocyanin
MSLKSRVVVLSLVALGALAVQANAGETAVDQKNLKFSVDSVSVKAGDTIKYHNSDDVNHNLNVVDSDDFAADQGIQKPGDSLAVKFDRAGTFTVKCAIHPKMKMTVVVSK